jgi:hypothetical protein
MVVCMVYRLHLVIRIEATTSMVLGTGFHIWCKYSYHTIVDRNIRDTEFNEGASDGDQ